jgi:hypothetical protein
VVILGLSVVFSFSYMSRIGGPSGRPYEMYYGDYCGGVHLFPFRTESLSPPAQMVLQSLRESMSLPIFSNPGPQGRDFFLRNSVPLPRLTTTCMIRTCLTILSFLALLVITPARAQQTEADSITPKADTTKPKYDSTLAFYFYNNFDQFGRVNVKPIDTALSHVINYNPIFRNNRLQATLGNTGTASQSLVPYPFTHPAGFEYGIHSFDPWLFQNDSVRYYKVMKTYTDIKYVQGAKKEIYFNATFSRNIYKSFNLGFDFRVLSSTGAYQRQKTNIVNFVLTAQYFTPDHRYAVIANLILNRIKNQENGGITSDSLFTQNLEKNRFVIPVNLTDAQNRVKESGVYIKNYFTIASRTNQKQDTTKPARKGYNLGRVIYSFQYNRQIQNYLDGDPMGGYYENVFYDSTSTQDSINVVRISNELGWTNPVLNTKKKFKILQMDFRIKHQYLEVTDLAGKTYMTQWIPSAAISLQPYYGLRLEANASYVLGDYNNGDFYLHADLGIVPGKQDGNAGVVHFSGTYAIQEPSWFLHRFNSNHFQWDNNLNKTGVIDGRAWYERKYLSTGLSLSRITHYTYLDVTASPAQLDNEFGYFIAWLRSSIPLWRFTFDGQFAYQNVQGTDALHVPDFAANLSILFTQPLFKGAAVLQPGLSFFYNTAYYSNTYMPDTRSFYLQTAEKTGNYLYMDVFVNVKIQRARLFVMYSHFNAGLMGRDYFMTPHYPMPDGAFRFGITWRFHD